MSRDQKPLVLLVDDEEDQRELMAECLEHEGFRVITATNGHEALELLAGERPIAIVMDLHMPVLDGWETTRRIKANDATKVIPVLILSAHAFGEHRVRAKDNGADEVISKPCAPPALAAKLRELIAW